MAEKRKRLSFKTALFKGAYVHNTVLTTLTGLCPVAAVCTSIKNALWLSLIFAVILLLCEVSASVLLKKFDRWLRVGLYAVISSVALLIPMLFMDEKTSASFGVYLPLLCVSGVIVIRCEKFAVKTSGYNSLVDAIAGGVGFFAVALITGVVRELVATGKIFGLDTGIPTIPSVTMPFFGFIIIGFAAALHKWSVKTFFPDEITDTFGMSKAFDKPVFKDPGLKLEKHKAEKKASDTDRVEDENLRPRYNIEEVEISFDGKEEI